MTCWKEEQISDRLKAKLNCINIFPHKYYQESQDLVHYVVCCDHKPVQVTRTLIHMLYSVHTSKTRCVNAIMNAHCNAYLKNLFCCAMVDAVVEVKDFLKAGLCRLVFALHLHTGQGWREVDHNDPSKPSHRLTNGPEPSKTIESDSSNIKRPS